MALLEARGLEHRDLLNLLEAAGYTPDTPATVLLNDAVAMAAVLGVSPLQLLIPATMARSMSPPTFQSNRGRSTCGCADCDRCASDDFAAFHRQAGLDDLDAERVAEHLGVDRTGPHRRPDDRPQRCRRHP